MQTTESEGGKTGTTEFHTTQAPTLRSSALPRSTYYKCLNVSMQKSNVYILIQTQIYFILGYILRFYDKEIPSKFVRLYWY